MNKRAYKGLLEAVVLLSIAAWAVADQQVLVHCAVNQDGIQIDEPVLMSMEKVLELAQAVPQQPQNFIGFTDTDGTVFQFFVDAPGKIWVEIPSVAEQGSYGKHVSESEFLELVTGLQAPYSQYRDNLGLEFEPWR